MNWFEESYFYAVSHVLAYELQETCEITYLFYKPIYHPIGSSLWSQLAGGEMSLSRYNGLLSNWVSHGP